MLITGESGTGKELVARAIHFHSLRRDRPFVALNCGALPETLLESELFGHMRGAFTGADTNKKGLLEVAETRHDLPRRDRRDEPGDAGQAAARAAGAAVPARRRHRGDRRPTSASSPRPTSDLPKMVADGRFREDLFYRINVIPMQLPPLRERREDIPLLAEHFLAKYAEQMGKPITGISHEAMALLHAATTGPATSASSRT